MITFQETIQRLNKFWEKQGCIVQHGHDLEMGAGTFNPHTFLRCLGPEPYFSAYVEPCRRPTDGRYGKNPNRYQHFFQYQVILKPSPLNIQELYVQSLEEIGLVLKEHDIRFVHDDWESPTLGAYGLGWEVWVDGMEVTQYTYLQTMGSCPLHPVSGELTYGLERLAMYLQKVDDFRDLKWNAHVNYGDLYHRNEVEWSHYNFEHASSEMWLRHFADFEKEANRLIEANLPIPACDFVMKASHAFNILDAKGEISVTERTGYITRIRNLARLIAAAYSTSREEQGHPLKNAFGQQRDSQSTAPKETAPSQFTSDQTTDFLLEIGSEELPAHFVSIGCANLEKKLKEFLDKEEISYQSIELFGTPRRLAALIKGIACGRAPEQIEKRGPAVAHAFDDEHNPLNPAKGFFRSLSLPEVGLTEIRSGHPHLSIQTIKGKEYLFAKVETAEVFTKEKLAEALPSLILQLNFPKKMRWSDLEISYARPLHWIVALLGSEVVPFQIGNISSGNTSYGHRQLSPASFSLSTPAEYASTLKEHFVLASIEERKETIAQAVTAIEQKQNAKAARKERVLREVTNLVEWPFVVDASFDSAFLSVPKEVLISEMVEHQKYFALVDDKGQLQNQFIITANNTPNSIIIEGNQRVLSARLADGAFLYKQDLKTSLSDWNTGLQTITFQQKLGTMHEKVERIEKHMETLLTHVPLDRREHALRAASLCKADLASGMVSEFPELQGVMGQYYALAQGENPEVARAVQDHWLPRNETDPLPQDPISTHLSLADKIDNLLGCFLADLKPTSSHDPYALRRQTLAIIKMVIENRYTLPLSALFRTCLSHFPKEFEPEQGRVLKETLAFLTQRLKTVFLDYGFQKDEINASIPQEVDDIYQTYSKVDALRTFRLSKDFSKLFEVYKRAKGQLSNHASCDLSTSLLKEPAEITLNQTLNTLQDPYKTALTTHNYSSAYGLLATLQPPLATLFDSVKILSDDPLLKQNRIALLQRVFHLFDQLLDFSKIQEK